MAKTGRNEPCPCGSGIKYKKCCLPKQQANAEPAQNLAASPASLTIEVENIRRIAAAHKGAVRVLGVFVLFSTTAGDAWLLEVSDKDGVMLAKGGKTLAVNIEENPETIEVDWTHTFAIKDNRFVVTSYKDKNVEIFDGYPVADIKSAVKAIRQKFSPDQLSKVHLHEQTVDAEQE